MAISIDWATKTISVPQADLTLIGGTLYEMNTETDFRQAINDLMDDEEGMPFIDPIKHTQELVVGGITYARGIEIINGYSVTFTPDSQWSVRLVGSNNNIFDVENGILNQNQVQVIPGNSAGLQIVVSGSGVLPGDITDIKNAIFDEIMEAAETFREQQNLMRAEAAGKVAVTPDGTNVKFRDAADAKDRIDATVDDTGQRTAVTTDGT